jgi:AbiU2
MEAPAIRIPSICPIRRLLRLRRPYGDEPHPVGVVPLVLAQRAVRETRNVDGRTALTTPTLVDRANEVIGRLFALDEEVANGRAFRALLQDLSERDLWVVREPHIIAISMVRAGLLRATISSVMACLDRGGRDRASVGQILDMMDAQVVAVFATGTAALQRTKGEYDVLVESELCGRGRRLRNEAIAHLLIPSDPIPKTTYETFYDLHDAAERLTIGLYEACGRGKPRFLQHQDNLKSHAEIFWDTYFDGMRWQTA